jgi:hypothetical protein
MNVHFIGSRSNIESEVEYYRSIVEYLKSKGHTLISDWVEDTYKYVKDTGDRSMDQGSFDWKKVDTDDAAAIARADVVIVEATKKSFFMGYRMAQAIQQKKPTLIMYRDNSFPGAADLGNAANLVYAVEYTKDNIEKVLGKFIEENTINTKDMRFNFFIDRPIYNYLRWAAFKTGRTKAEVLRELVQREIKNRDS